MSNESNNNSCNLIRKMFVGRNAASEAVMFAVKETKAGNEVDSADVIGSTIQINYYVNKESTEDEGLKVEIQPDIVEVVTQSVADTTKAIEKTEETDVLVPDWEHAESLETSEELEVYFEPLGFNANPNHKPKTILRKAKEHFRV